MKTEYQKQIVHATPENTCPHCDKSDWCYRLGDLSVCNRDLEPATGWYKTSKTDQDGHYYYAPVSEKKTAKKQTRYWVYKDLDNNNIARAVRIDVGDGSKPRRYQEHWNGKTWVKGLGSLDRANIPVYRYAEIREAIAQSKTIYIAEGETCADALWDLGMPATTNIAGCKQWKSSDAECLKGAVEIVICPDRDKPGINYGLKVSEDFPNALWLYAPPSEFFWLYDHLPDSQGLDIKDWIDEGATKEMLLSQLTQLSPGKFNESLPLYSKPKEHEQAQKVREVIVEAEEIYTQKAVDCLFSDSAYISIHEQLYKYTGTHYELCSYARERRRILEWCKTTPVEVRGKWKYALAKPETVNKIWTWVLTNFAVDSEEINPPGINCLNGILQVSWVGRKVKYELVKHNPSFYFTHVTNFKYDPYADDTDCNRLLAALEPGQQLIFLRTIAASLDLNTVRKYQGRAVKALLCQGTGSNGKDTLREAVRCILGAGMTGASVTDFQQYDGGRKFPLTKIEHSQINWSSENSHFARLDSLQGLKAAITGETIDIEAKNSMEYPITPRGVFLFNVNEPPLLDGGSEAIASRWSVLEFNKTFKKNACVARRELEADSRFRYDPEFLDSKVCPALLNKILEQLQTVVMEGIDYSCCDGALRRLQEESNHLWQFVNEVGIVESPGERLYISDLWKSLEQWYEKNGTLEYERIGDRSKKIWHDQPRKSDRNVTALNQVGKRFKELFPNAEIKVHREREDSSRRGQKYFEGYACSGSAVDRHRILTGSTGSDGSAKLATLARLIQEVSQFDELERLTAIQIMENFLSSQSNVDQNADPCDPAHSMGVPCRSTADPLQRDIQKEPSLQMTLENSANQTSGNADDSNQTPVAVTVVQNFEMPVTNKNSIVHNQYPPIEWVRDKAGISWNIEKQDENMLTGHRPGLRGRQKIKLEDCAEIHYKKSPEEAEV